jgi:hypothetical protein
MKPDDTPRQIQFLASVLALVSGYYAIRATLNLPKYREMFEAADELNNQPSSLGTLILLHPYWYLAFVIGTLVVTLLAIWKEFRGHNFIYPLGIVLLFILIDRAVASGLAPLVRMISSMGQ